MTTKKQESPFTFTFKNLDRDIEKYVSRFGQRDEIGSMPVIRGYDKAKRYVFNAYLDHKAYEAVAHYIVACWNWDWGVNAFFHEASDAFKRDKEFNKLKRIWYAAIAAQKGHFWQLHAIKGDTDVQRTMSKVQRIALKHMTRFRQILLEIDDVKGVERLDEEIALLERGERRKTRLKPDPQAMTQDLFWTIIGQAGKAVESIAEQVESITSQLEAYEASQIKRFQKILDQKMQRAYHWDIWALAYMAQDGCSDDAFEGFRAWLVLQGRKVYELALQDINKAMKYVPAGLETRGDELLTAPLIAYEARAGKPMSPTKIRPQEPDGNEWEEHELETRHPGVFAYYRKRAQAVSAQRNAPSDDVDA